MHERHRQTGQDRQTDRETDRQLSDSIGRTVLQTVAQKFNILTAVRIKTAILRYRAKFPDDQSSRCQGMSIYRCFLQNGGQPSAIFGRLFVKRFALCYPTVVCHVLSVLSCLSVTFVQLWPNGWTDQDETRHAGRPWPWPHCVRWGSSSPSPMGTVPQIFGPCLLWPNGWMDEAGTWQGGRPRPKRLCVRWGPRSILPQKGAKPRPQFSAHVYCGQTAGWIKMALGMEVGFGPGHIVLDGEPAPLPPKGTAPAQFSAHFYCCQTAL